MTLLLLLTFLFIEDELIFELLPTFGWEAFLFIFFVLDDFYNAFLDFDLAIEGLRFRLFLSLLVLGIFLLELLQCKYGEVPVHYRAKIEAADSSQLLAWTRQVLKVPNLEKLFEESMH